MTANSKRGNRVALTAVAVLVVSLAGNWIQHQSLNQKKSGDNHTAEAR
jgi:hypothetical protein